MKKNTLKEETILSALGIGLEYYNIFLYGYLWPIILPEFIPNTGLNFNLLLLLLFILAPISGAIFFGHLADKQGRKKILVWMIAFVAIPSFVISILPGFEVWGWYSSLVFLILRFVQTFAFGGDVIGLLTFVIEDVPIDGKVGKRGMYGGFMSTGAGLGVAFAALMISIFYPTSEVLVNSIYWRILMCIGGFGIFVAAYFHVKIHETKTFDDYREKRYQIGMPIKDLIKKSWLSMIQVLGMTNLTPIITILIFAFFPYHVGMNLLKLSPRHVMFSMMLALIVYSLAAPFFGHLSDIIGRKKVLKTVSILFFAFPIVFIIFFKNISVHTYFFLQFLLVIISSAYYGVTFTACSETFSTHIRFTGVSLSYALTYVIFGGAFGSYVTKTLENKAIFSIFSPFLYLSLGSIILFISMTLKKETAFEPLQNN